MQYIRIRSLSFWAGALLILCGLALGVHEAQPLGWYGDALANWIGDDTSPAQLILTGLGIIGIRRAIR